MNTETILGLVSIILTIMGSAFVITWRFSKMQTEQSKDIKENKKSIDNLNLKTDSCELHQSNISAANNKIIELEDKIKKQTAFNIQTEANVKVLMERTNNMNINMTEIKADIKELLKLRRSEQ